MNHVSDPQAAANSGEPHGHAVAIANDRRNPIDDLRTPAANLGICSVVGVLMPSTFQAVAGAQTADPIWLTVRQAAQRAQCGPKVIYRAVAARRLKAATIGGRRELRFRADWIDSWLEACSAPVEVTPRP